MIVYHYHFVGWPDSGVPADPASMLDYLWDARLRQNEAGPSVGPMTVHCSAGIGRTGTFVALDCLMTELTKGGPSATPLDVQRLVKILRRQRFGMVQTQDQFKFVYEALLVHIRAAILRQTATGADGGNSADSDERRRNYENVQYWKSVVERVHDLHIRFDLNWIFRVFSVFFCLILMLLQCRVYRAYTWMSVWLREIPIAVVTG